ncbi:hypothetical protein J4729_07535 [Leisingera sp. HS039]|uniref:Gp49 family protein n=1 Tax=Leisingera sp. HS039 TaxID=2818496 RepID=UPI001B3A0347|nr:Gp49 family protein [Leisingera sp. HS039]MBQ4824401.1 hypothetical protein [Leisingera sp. HS039]
MADKTDTLRVTPEMVDLEIKRELYHIPEDTTLTICTIELHNGFTVTGESACADPENFNTEEGQKRAKIKAREKVFLLLAFRSRDQAHNQEAKRDRALEKLRDSETAQSDPLLRAALEEVPEPAKLFLSECCEVDGSDGSFASTQEIISAFQDWQVAREKIAWSPSAITRALQRIDQINGKPIRYVKQQVTGWTGFQLKASK